MKLNKLFITSLLTSLLLLLASSRVASQSELLSIYQSVMDVNDISSVSLRTSPSHRLDSIVSFRSHKAIFKFEKNMQSAYSLSYCDTSSTYSIPGIYSKQEFNDQDQIIYDGTSILLPGTDVDDLTFESLEDLPPFTFWRYTYNIESQVSKINF